MYMEKHRSENYLLELYNKLNDSVYTSGAVHLPKYQVKHTRCHF